MLTDFVLDALAVARLSRLVREDTILDRPRYWLTTHAVCGPRAKTFLTCPWCVSVWCAAGVMLARWRFPRAWRHAVVIPAASYVAAIAALHVEEPPE